MHIEICLSTFGAEPAELLSAARHADGVGVSGVWLMDHLSGAVHGQGHVLECLSSLSAVAVATERARIGTLVLNCGIRHPSVVAQTAATIAESAPGRLVLGIGAGGGTGTPYAAEMIAAGFSDDPAPVRRERVGDTLAVLDAIWQGRESGYSGHRYRVGSTTGFARPEPLPRTLVAGFGPKMAALAGTWADAFNTAAAAANLESLFETAVGAATAAGRSRPELTAFADFDDAWIDSTSPGRRRLAAADTDTLILVVAPPFDRGQITAIARTADS